MLLRLTHKVKASFHHQALYRTPRIHALMTIAHGLKLTETTSLQLARMPCHNQQYCTKPTIVILLRSIPFNNARITVITPLPTATNCNGNSLIPVRLICHSKTTSHFRGPEPMRTRQQSAEHLGQLYQ